MPSNTVFKWDTASDIRAELRTMIVRELTRRNPDLEKLRGAKRALNLFLEYDRPDICDGEVRAFTRIFIVTGRYSHLEIVSWPREVLLEKIRANRWMVEVY